MIIENMTLAHVGQVAELEKVCFGSEAWSLNSVTTELDNPLSLWLVALDGEKLAGYVGSQTVCNETDMMNVAVSPEHRRQGIAEALVTDLVEKLRKIESHSLTLEVRASNDPAIGLYEKLGFAQVGRRKNYYRNPREDALILRKEWAL